MYLACLFFYLITCFYLFIFFFVCVCVFYTEIQDGRQKWQENIFCEKPPVDSADTLPVKNFVKIALFRSISEINTFLCLIQAAKSGGKMFFLRNNASRLCIYPAGQKFCQKRSILLHFGDKHLFCISCRNSRWPPKMAGKQFLRKVASRLCRYPTGQKLC